MNATAAHLHLGPAGANGPVVAPLFGPAPGDGRRTSGVLADGALTAASLVGPPAGRPVAELIAAMQAGNAYANVHTTLYPGGEIRGQVWVSAGKD